MATRRRARVVDSEGKLGWLRGASAEDPRHPLALIHLATGEELRVPFDVLEHHDDGGYSMTARWSDFAQTRDDGVSIPVIEERVTVAVRPAPAERVRVRRRIVSEHVPVEVPLWSERVEVENVPINQFVDSVPQPRQEGDTLIIPIVEEVVEVRLRVREEMRVRVVRDRTVHRESVLVRKHEIDVERSPQPTSQLSTKQGEDL